MEEIIINMIHENEFFIFKLREVELFCVIV